MTYHILRDGRQFGPYSLADLQRYVDSGQILLADMTRSEGMQEWVPVSQVLGNIPVQPPPAGMNYGQVPSYGTGYDSPGGRPGPYPDPPGLHWGLVFLFACLSCGLFLYVWMFIQAAYVKKLDPESRGIVYYSIGVGLILADLFLQLTGSASDLQILIGFANIAGAVLFVMGHFNLKSSLERHFNSAEPTGMILSGGMTFFFGTIYLQYHLNIIKRWRTTGQLA